MADVERIVLVRVAVHRCDSCPEDSACGLYPEGAPAIGERPRGLFGYDASREECSHTWPRVVAEEMARRWNGDPAQPARPMLWEVGEGVVEVAVNRWCPRCTRRLRPGEAACGCPPGDW
jgi:hypothetical protein